MRLYEAAASAGVTMPADLARELEVTQQTLTNWHQRGVSAEGAFAAESRFGFRAAWIREGTGAMRAGDAVPEKPASQAGVAGLEAALEQLGAALASLPESDRNEVGDALRQWAKYGGKEAYRQMVGDLFDAAAKGPSSKRRFGH